MENFTPISAAIGGLLVGASAVMLLGLQGRIAGISGILGGVLAAKCSEGPWRMLFLAGLVIGALAYSALGGDLSGRNLNPFALADNVHFAILAAAGLLVGFGSQIGSGCTSGHGVCGIGLLSPRSLAGTLCFMLTAGITVYIVRAVVVL